MASWVGCLCLVDHNEGVHMGVHGGVHDWLIPRKIGISQSYSSYS